MRVPGELSDWKQTAESRFRNALNELLTNDCHPGLKEVPGRVIRAK